MDGTAFCDCGMTDDEHEDLHIGRECEFLDFQNRGYEVLRKIIEFNQVSSQALSRIAVERGGRELETHDLAPVDSEGVAAEASSVAKAAIARQSGIVIAEANSECWSCGSPVDIHIGGPMGSECDLGRLLQVIDEFLESADERLLQMGLSHVAWSDEEVDASWVGEELSVEFFAKLPTKAQ